MIRSRLFQNFYYCPSVTKKKTNAFCRKFFKVMRRESQSSAFYDNTYSNKPPEREQTDYSEHPSYNGFTNDVSWLNFFINRNFVTDRHVQKFLRSWEYNNLQILILIKPNDLLVNLFKTLNYYSWNDFCFFVIFSCPSVTYVRNAHLAYYFSMRISDIIN